MSWKWLASILGGLGARALPGALGLAAAAVSTGTAAAAERDVDVAARQCDLGRFAAGGLRCDRFAAHDGAGEGLSRTWVRKRWEALFGQSAPRGHAANVVLGQGEEAPVTWPRQDPALHQVHGHFPFRLSGGRTGHAACTTTSWWPLNSCSSRPIVGSSRCDCAIRARVWSGTISRGHRRRTPCSG